MSSASSSALSGALKALASNPLDFLTKNAIVFAPVSVPPEYRSNDGSLFISGKAGVKLVRSRTASTTYNLQFVAINDLLTDKEAVAAYVLAYKNNNRNNDAPFVEILRKDYAENTFLFTVGLTGCSVIGTSSDNTYRIFHDRRMDSAVLYNNVEMRVDFDDYRIGGRYLSRTGNAITLMLFQGGAWKMFLQRQLPHPDTSKPTWEIHAVEQTGPVTAEAFENRRDIYKKRLNSNGRKLKVSDSLIAGAVDGVVVGVQFNEQAISGWKALRSAIKSKIDIYFQDPNRDPKLQDTYDRFADDNSGSEQIDETWIWLQIKNRAPAQQR